MDVNIFQKRVRQQIAGTEQEKEAARNVLAEKTAHAAAAYADYQQQEQRIEDVSEYGEFVYINEAGESTLHRPAQTKDRGYFERKKEKEVYQADRNVSQARAERIRLETERDQLRQQSGVGGDEQSRELEKKIIKSRIHEIHLHHKQALKKENYTQVQRYSLDYQSCVAQAQAYDEVINAVTAEAFGQKDYDKLVKASKSLWEKADKLYSKYLNVKAFRSAEASDLAIQEEVPQNKDGELVVKGEQSVYKNPKTSLSPVNVWKAGKGNLFDHAPNPLDVHQGLTQDCYLMSALSCLAYQQPERIQESMKDNKNGTVTVRFYDSFDYVEMYKDVPPTEKRAKIRASMEDSLTRILSVFYQDNEQMRQLKKSTWEHIEEQYQTAKRKDEKWTKKVQALEKSIEKKSKTVNETKAADDTTDPDDDMDLDMEEIDILELHTEDPKSTEDEEEFEDDRSIEELTEELEQARRKRNDENEYLERIQKVYRFMNQYFGRNDQGEFSHNGCLYSNNIEWYRKVCTRLLEDEKLKKSLEAHVGRFNFGVRNEYEVQSNVMNALLNAPDSVMKAIENVGEERLQNKEVFVTVEKTIPSFAGMVETNAEGSLWVQMIEKAYAARYGDPKIDDTLKKGTEGYDAISLGKSSTFLKRFLNESYTDGKIDQIPSGGALEAVTNQYLKDAAARAEKVAEDGRPSIEEIIRQAKARMVKDHIDKMDERIEQMTEHLENHSGYHHAFYTGIYKERENHIYHSLEERLGQGEVITVGVDVEKSREDKIKATGIRTGHAYSVLKVQEENDLKYVLLRDPYARFRRKYEHVKGFGEDATYRKINDSQSLRLAQNDSQGLFYMELNDFLSTFNMYSGVKN